MYRILSIDGGGSRGLLPARILAHIEQRLIEELGNKDFRLGDIFDFVAGTSVGGILALIYLTPAGARAHEYTATEVWQQCAKMLPGVFSVDLWKKINTVWGLGGTKYDARNLETWLRFFFHQMSLSQIETPCLITAYDFYSRSPIYFRSHAARAKPEDDFKLFDIARATSAAPSYFTPHEFADLKEHRSYLCSDGILFAYDPALSAYAEVRRLSRQHSASQMYLLSMGTGYRRRGHDIDSVNEWGGLHWGVTIGRLMADCSALNVDEQLNQVFHDSPENYVRVNPELDENCSSDMDCATPENLSALIALAENYIDKNADSLEQIVQTLASSYRGQPSAATGSAIPIVNTEIEYVPQWQQSVSSYLQEQSSDSDNIAVESGAFSVTYGQLEDWLARLRTGLSGRLGLTLGSRAVIAVSDPLTALIIGRTLLEHGVGFSVYPPELSPMQLAREFDRGARVLFIDSAFIAWLANEDLPQLSVVAVEGNEFVRMSALNYLTDVSIKHLWQGLRSSLPTGETENVPAGLVNLSDVIALSRRRVLADTELESKDCALLRASSHECYSQQNLVAAAGQLAELIGLVEDTDEPPPCFIIALPEQNHSMLILTLVLAPRLGAQIVFANVPRDIVRANKRLMPESKKYIFATPRRLAYLLGSDRVKACISKVDTAVVFGHHISGSLLDRWRKLTDANMLLARMLFPEGPVVGSSLPLSSDADLISPLKATEFHQVDQDEEEPFSPILVRGPQLAEWQQQQKSFNNHAAWVSLTDSGQLDENGCLLAQ